MLQLTLASTRVRRRCLVVGYYALVMTLGVAWGFELFRGSRFVGAFVPLLFVISIALGGLRAGGPVRPFSPFYDTAPSLTLLSTRDRNSVGERDICVRDRAHYAAYSALRWALLFSTFAVLWIFALARTWLAPVAACLLYPAFALIMSLPQAILLWTEPDPAPESSSGLTGAA